MCSLLLWKNALRCSGFPLIPKTCCSSVKLVFGDDISCSLSAMGLPWGNSMAERVRDMPSTTCVEHPWEHGWHYHHRWLRWGRSAAGATTSSLNIRLIVFWRRSPLSLKKNIHRAKPQISKTYVLLMFYLCFTYFPLILGLNQLIINLRYLILARNKFNTSSTQVN